MTKKIILLSDGTGNAAANVWRTNVWRIFELLDLSRPEQVARYDDGVGSSSFKPLALLGGVFGWGLKRNVLDLYKFLCRNYEPDAKIYGFGFSRGAFTIRILVDFVLDQGLIDHRAVSEAELDRHAKAAYRAYREGQYGSILPIEPTFRWIRNALIWLKDGGRKRYDNAHNRFPSSIEFIGLWDTVAAYGTPVKEMTRGISQWIWPLELPDRVLRPEVRRACHALAIDDDRTSFHPVLWTERDEPMVPFDESGSYRLREERISQVWFAGAHSNVGGGYPDDALANIPLLWIMEEAKFCGLKFKAPPTADPNAFLKVGSAVDKDGRLYSPRSGLGGYYQYGPRHVRQLCGTRILSKRADAVEIDLPKIHESVLERIGSNSNAYAPIGLPSRYAVVTADGTVRRGWDYGFETRVQGEERARRQENVWNLVWLKRVVYFMTVAASLYIALFWLFHDADESFHEFDNPFRPVSELVRLGEAFLPSFFQRWWGNVYAANPRSFLIGLLLIVFFVSLGSRLEMQIADKMRTIWRSQRNSIADEKSPLDDSIFWLRTQPAYTWTIGQLKQSVLPFLFAVLVLYLGLASVSHFSFYVLDSGGFFCSESKSLSSPEVDKVSKTSFRTDAICAGTKFALMQNEEYCITIKPKEDVWTHWGFSTNLKGFRVREKDQDLGLGRRLMLYAAVPLRRVLFRRWFRVIARVGTMGSDEYFLDPPSRGLVDGKLILPLGGLIPIRRNGELFLYLNEAVVGIPWLAGVFYRNNKGTAEVEVWKTEKGLGPKRCERTPPGTSG